MKKRTKWLLISSSAVIVVFLTVAIFIYYRVDDSIEIQEEINPFKSEKIILRLDETRLTSDSLTAFITSLMKKAHVYGLGVSIINHNELIYQRFFGAKN